MILKRFEEILRNRLKGHESELDLDYGWNQLEAKLSKKKDNRKYFFGFFLFLGILGSLYVFNDDFSANNDLTDTMTAELSSKTPSGEKNITVASLPQEEVSTVETPQPIAEKIYESSSKATAKIQDESPESALAISLLAETTQPVLVEAKPNKLVQQAKESYRTNQNVISDNIKSNKKSEIKTTEAIAANFLTKKATTKTLANEEQLVSHTSKSSTQVDKKPKAPEQSLVADMRDIEKESTNISMAESLDLLPFSNHPTFDLADRYFEMNLPFAQSIEKKIEKENQSSWMIGLVGGAGMYKHNFIIDENVEADPTIKDHLQSLETFHFGAKVGYLFSSRMSLQTGLEYMQLNEVLDIDENIAVSQQLTGTTEIIVNTLTGDSTYVNGNLIQIGTKNVKATNYNAYKTINVPLGINYDIVGKKNWGLGLGAGVVFNISANKEGVEWKEEAIIDSQDSDYYKTSFGMSWYAEPQIKYFLSKGWNLSLNPYLRQSISNWSNQDGISLKPTQYGIRIGLEKRL